MTVEVVGSTLAFSEQRAVHRRTHQFTDEDGELLAVLFCTHVTVIDHRADLRELDLAVALLEHVVRIQRPGHPRCFTGRAEGVHRVGHGTEKCCDFFAAVGVAPLHPVGHHLRHRRALGDIADDVELVVARQPDVAQRHHRLVGVPLCKRSKVCNVLALELRYLLLRYLNLGTIRPPRVLHPVDLRTADFDRITHGRERVPFLQQLLERLVSHVSPRPGRT